jgi:hypothetical protein
MVLCRCETWFLILREEHRLRVFEKRTLRRMFRQMKGEMTGYIRNYKDHIKGDEIGIACKRREEKRREEKRREEKRREEKRREEKRREEKR